MGLWVVERPVLWHAKKESLFLTLFVELSDDGLDEVVLRRHVAGFRRSRRRRRRGRGRRDNVHHLEPVQQKRLGQRIKTFFPLPYNYQWLHFEAFRN